jgi:hypothetical protein
MATRFQPKITRARFALSRFSPEQMQGLGDLVVHLNKTRLAAGKNVLDSPAKPLKPGRAGRRGYPDYKSRRGLQPVRDWNWTGRTLRGMRTLAANENRVIVGFSDPVADFRAAVNNRRERQFGVSPADREAIAQYVSGIRFVTVAASVDRLSSGASRFA